MDENQLNLQVSEAKTDEQELSAVLESYDLDEELESIFNRLDARFRSLDVQYQSLLNTRRFLKDA